MTRKANELLESQSWEVSEYAFSVYQFMSQKPQLQSQKEVQQAKLEQNR